MINSYPKVYALGHRAIYGIFEDEVVVEEKVDGSQFSMGIIDDGLQCRSKEKHIILDAPEKLFTEAINTAMELKNELAPGFVYRCEYLKKPKHNVLAYDRIPNKHLVVFDVMTGLETYMDYDQKRNEANRIGLEAVPILYRGKIDEPTQLTDFLNCKSMLGGQNIEGVVVKNINKFTRDGKMMVGKYVSEAFKEVHKSDWKSSNPNRKDLIQIFIERYRTISRWDKAVMHLREKGLIEDDPKDIGSIIKEVQLDTKQECGDEIKEELFNHFWSQIQRGIIAGLPEWYKKKLLEEVFNG